MHAHTRSAVAAPSDGLLPRLNICPDMLTGLKVSKGSIRFQPGFQSLQVLATAMTQHPQQQNQLLLLVGHLLLM